MAALENVSHVQVKFFTKQQQYAVPDSQFSVPANVGVEELSSLISSLLSTGNTEECQNVSFDFLINGEFLRISLQEHMEYKSISTETVVEVEYVERQAAPTPEDSLLHDDWVSCVEGSGKYILSGCYDNVIKLWTIDGDNLLTIPGHNGAVKAVTWLKQDDAPISVFVSTSHDQTAMIWEWNRNINSVECAHICKGHAGSVDCVAVDQSKTRFCTGSWDKMLKIWSSTPKPGEDDAGADQAVKKKKKTDQKVATRVPVLTLSGHKEGISACSWIDSNEVCTASWDHTMKLWDIDTAQEKGTLNSSKVFTDLSYSSLNRMLITSSTDRHVRLWDPRITDGAVVKCTFTSHTGWVSCVAWSPVNEYHFISGSYDMVVKMWDTRSPKAPLYNMTGHEDKILGVDWSIPEYMLSGGADNHVKIFKYSDKS